MYQVIPLKTPIADAAGQKVDAGPVIAQLIVVKSLHEVDQSFLILQTLLVLSGLLALVGALICSWVISANVLRPLSDLVQTAQAITLTARGNRLSSLHQRVPRPHGDDEMVQVVDTFNDMLSALESTTLAQRRFVADASHELRAPLTTIRGNLAFLAQHANELPSEERSLMLNDAHEETLRLAQLVDELLLLARADANEIQSSTSLLVQETNQKKTSSVDLDHSALQLIRQLRGRMSLEGSALQLEVARIEPVRVSANEEDVRRILLILLDNAIKYTSSFHDDDTGSVKVSVFREGNDAVLRVQDNGMGISEEDLPHIFERFYRADEARSRQGTGLGLSIAQTLVEQCAGQIDVQSTLGQGTTFILRIPSL
jgi:signal transduction histidine kinase